ncbi:hypothetical protein BG004_005241 [Podila humilis]|nr:hypothetical protein BG004_005241 [Podila humilis]
MSASSSPRRQPLYPLTPGPAPMPQGSPQSLPLPGMRSPNPPYQSPPHKQTPYLAPGYGYDFETPGYYFPGEGWRQQPPPMLQKKPKELDKAMWVGNVLSDTTVAELQAVFEELPTETAEGDIEHDIPESIFILQKSNCAFVNYSSHEAVDRAVLRFHHKEFKSTRLVCRPRKDPGTDPHRSHKASGSGRSHHHPHLQQLQQLQQHQPHHQGHLHHMPDAAYFTHDRGLLESSRTTDRLSEHSSHSEAHVRMDQMRLDASPLHYNSSSGGDGPMALAHLTYRDKTYSKQSQSSSSLGYADCRYFILKSLSDEDLKLSVQYGLWATQPHLVPILNEAFNNSKDVFLIFSANKSREFFGYARMMGSISKEFEDEIDNANPPEQAWRPVVDMDLSPEMKASFLVTVEEAAKEGKEISTQEAERIALASTSTKSWGIKFPIQWMHVHKVPFSRAARMYNSYYENREVKVSKDGTEIEPTVGHQLIALFQKNNGQQQRESASCNSSQTNSEVGGDSRRSSIAGDPPSTLTPRLGQRGSSRRLSVLSVKSTSSCADDRRGSHDPSQNQGSNKSGFSSPHHTHRGEFGGDQGLQQHDGGGGGLRSNSRQNNGHDGFTNQVALSPQGSYNQDMSPDQSRGWNRSKSRNAYSTSPVSGPHGLGAIDSSPKQSRQGYISNSPSQQEYKVYRKTGIPGGGTKYHQHQSQYSFSNNGHGYDQYGPSPSSNIHTQYHRRHGGHSAFRPGLNQMGGLDHPSGAGFRRQQSGGGSLHLGAMTPAGMYDHNHSRGPRSVGPPFGGEEPLPPRPAFHGGAPMYGCHGVPMGYPGAHPPHGGMLGYQMLRPYVGYPFGQAPNPYLPGVIQWYPSQVQPVSMGMIPGTGTEGVPIEGLIPLIGYDGVPYGYIHPEEAFRHQQQIYGPGYMSTEYVSSQIERGTLEEGSAEKDAEEGDRVGGGDCSGNGSNDGVGQAENELAHKEASSVDAIVVPKDEIMNKEGRDSERSGADQGSDLGRGESVANGCLSN